MLIPIAQNSLFDTRIGAPNTVAVSRENITIPNRKDRNIHHQNNYSFQDKRQTN